MKTKLEVLESVKRDIAQNGVVTCKYKRGNCYCAVGYVLKEIGVTDDDLILLGGDSISRIIKLNAPDAPKEACERVSALVTEAGFTGEELQVLQDVNDDGDVGESVQVARYVESMIETLSNK